MTRASNINQVRTYKEVRYEWPETPELTYQEDLIAGTKFIVAAVDIHGNTWEAEE